MNHEAEPGQQDLFSTESAGLPETTPPSIIRLHDGDQLDLTVHPVRKTIDGVDLRMLAYNGSIPGSTLHVDQGAELTVRVTNDGDVETTAHWHGLRLENRYDGVPHETQQPIPVGGAFTYKLQFPDAGFYWYHPHVREDYGQEMGLYGTIVVEPEDPSFWPAADRFVTLTLDDLLVEDGRIAPFRRSGATHTAMGRFGNVMLTNGEPDYLSQASVGEVVRLYLVNTANTRIFNVGLRGARMKLVGGDSGRYEHETFVDAVMLAPSERAVVDALFETAGDVRLEHRTPDKVYDLGRFTVSGAGEGQAGHAVASYQNLRDDPELSAERRALEHDSDREPDKVLSFFSRMPLLYGDSAATASVYACPMHPEVTDSAPSTCPKCGMKLVPAEAAAPHVVEATSHVDEAEHAHEHDGAHTHEHDSGDGLEWEDLMPEINRRTDQSNMFWELVDQQTGAVNGDITWSFTVGDRVKIRLINGTESDHPMHHPFHVHGAGRFLVLARDGEPELNLVWKDTVLLRAGQTVDILLDVSNPGLWMAHCHIAEHMQTGMMFSFNVARREDAAEAAPATGEAA